MTEQHDRSARLPEEVEMTATLEQATPALLGLVDLDLPGRFTKAEIVGGSAIVSPLRFIHNLTIHRLMSELDQKLPTDLLYGSDVLTPFEIEENEYCPDIAVVPRIEAERNGSICKPEWIEFVFEVVSPTTRAFDYGIKADVYARAGIAEYVIFDPYTREATRLARPSHGKYALREVVEYGKPVRIEEPFPIVIETTDLPVDPKD
jgi:Uma2 family endonuclease